MMADERVGKSKAIDVALTQIEKQFGKGSIMRLGDRIDSTGVRSISTGSISFDAALGVGGFPKGRVVEIFGPESSGKTTLTLQIVAESQVAPATTVVVLPLGGTGKRFPSGPRISMESPADFPASSCVVGPRF